jgi:hypothetical protein
MAVQLRLLRLTPVEAVIECLGPGGVEIRGRVTGPSCLYSTTIEVAHHVRGGRIIIPEPAWWDPQSPFVYHAAIETWCDGLRVEVEEVRLGLRHTVRTGERMIHNGRPVDIKLTSVEVGDEAELRRVRRAGFNAVQLPAALAEQVCEAADRIGVFVVPDGPIKMDPLRHPSAITS